MNETGRDNDGAPVDQKEIEDKVQLILDIKGDPQGNSITQRSLVDDGQQGGKDLTPKQAQAAVQATVDVVADPQGTVPQDTTTQDTPQN